jgi:hypothetical protein
MGIWKLGRSTAILMVAGVTFLSTGGCQQTGVVSHRRLIEHQAMIDFSGLKPAEPFENLKVMGAVPRSWDALTPRTNAFMTHQQWRSPSTKTGVGVAYIRMPLPVNTGLLLWLAKREYKANDGRILSEWTDDLGRRWFEAENANYRVRGYVVVNGFQAWVIYFGYKSHFPPDPAELSLAARAADSILPNLKKGQKPTPTTAPAEIVAQNAK